MESYMLHQGHTLVDRLDASTCLRIMEVWHPFDLARDAGAADPWSAQRRPGSGPGPAGTGVS